MLKDMLQAQISFQKNFFEPSKMTREDKIKWTKEFALCAHQELAEVLDAIDWKTYHGYDRTYSDDNVKEELIDVIKFVLNLCIVWEMSADDIKRIFDEKTTHNINRFKSKNNV